MVAEAHVAVSRRHAELAEQAVEQGVVAVVEDDEPGVDRCPRVGPVRDGDRVDVAAGAALTLEKRHLMAALQQVRRAEAGGAAADHRDLQAARVAVHDPSPFVVPAPAGRG